MSQWFPLHCHSHGSFLDGLSKPSQIAERIEELGYAGSALTDHGSISLVPAFIKEMSKKNLQAIPGCEFYVCQKDATFQNSDNRSLSHLCVLAKGEQGWKNLMRASSSAHLPEHSYFKPRLDLERLAAFSQGEFITFSGHMGSDLANVIFDDPKLAYRASNEQEAKSLASKNWASRVFETIEKYQALFGQENFFVEIQLIDWENLPAAVVIAEGLRWAAKKKGVPCIATADSHYCRQEDAVDQRVLLCTALRTTFKEVYDEIDKGEDVGLSTFFKSNKYHIPSLEEIQELHTPQEMENTLKIAGRCSSFKIGSKPLLPQFPDLTEESPEEKLRTLCLEGWKSKVHPIVKDDPVKKQEYDDRVKEELGVLNKAGLAPYFLIVWDYCNYARSQGWKLGRGRGSAAGCMVSHLLNITNIDPIDAGLLFTRFYNEGRNTEDNIALPDIDTDFPVSKRDQMIEYIRDKYGREYVSQMTTFSRMQGRGALKDVLRAHNRCSPIEMNEVTKFIPDESQISDELEKMGDEASIILWALRDQQEKDAKKRLKKELDKSRSSEKSSVEENNKKCLSDYCYLDDTGELQGPLALDFEQAIRIEGTIRGVGKHPSGVIVCSEKIAEICPMIYDKSSKEMTLGVNMKDSEMMGLVKFDILGLNTLDKIQQAEQLIRTGVIVD